jgi:hypothetical protein
MSQRIRAGLRGEREEDVLVNRILRADMFMVEQRWMLYLG